MKPKEKKTPRLWLREVTTRRMVCVLCGNKIQPLSKILTAHFRGTIVLCNDCEKMVPKERLDISEDPVIFNLPYYGEL